MSIELTQPADITQRIQARDGVAVVVFTKYDCRQCDMTKGKLDKESVYFTAVNVEEDQTAYAYVTETLGRRQMPVVVASTLEGDVVWSGFQPEMIRQHITHRADAA
jgi:glutaredoxin-like protein NrdH